MTSKKKPPVPRKTVPAADHDALWIKFKETLAASEAMSAALGDLKRSSEEEITDWILVADGIKHDPRCINHFSPTAPDYECLRCQLRVAQVIVRRWKWAAAALLLSVLLTGLL